MLKSNKKSWRQQLIRQKQILIFPNEIVQSRDFFIWITQADQQDIQRGFLCSIWINKLLHKIVRSNKFIFSIFFTFHSVLRSEKHLKVTLNCHHQFQYNCFVLFLLYGFIIFTTLRHHLTYYLLHIWEFTFWIRNKI